MAHHEEPPTPLRADPPEKQVWDITGKAFKWRLSVAVILILSAGGMLNEFNGLKDSARDTTTAIREIKEVLIQRDISQTKLEARMLDHERRMENTEEMMSRFSDAAQQIPLIRLSVQGVEKSVDRVEKSVGRLEERLEKRQQ